MLSYLLKSRPYYVRSNNYLKLGVNKTTFHSSCSLSLAIILVEAFILLYIQKLNTNKYNKNIEINGKMHLKYKYAFHTCTE